MDILPAIDLIKGKCVRLIQGEYHRQITYEDNPVRQARLFIEAGADWLHIVDLDGAKVGKSVNSQAVAAIAALGKLKIEVGGGIRDEQTIRSLLDIGVTRVIIGTRAVSDFEWFAQMAEKFPQKLVLGLDARGSKVATEGWTKETPQKMLDFAEKCDKLPLAAIVYTDITKDGMLSGPNLERTKALVGHVTTPIVASGGIHTIEDIQRLKQVNVPAAIIGRALYEQTLSLEEALRCAR